MTVFTVDGVRMDIPERMLVPNLRAALEEARYEGQERRALRAHLRPGDRVLELGAGAGLLAVLAARVVGAEAVTAVEANPEMLDIIRATLRENGAPGVRLLHGAVVPDEAAGGAVEFHVHPGFWSAALAPNPRLKARRHAVPALGFRALLDEADANVLVCDIEGGEE
ncbi:MAG: FkbM family methyltransferase, partial [Rhodobacteraceae bacterium]|nr:FkbM family methyltransferase [Paracoccaceae bacterium]